MTAIIFILIPAYTLWLYWAIYTERYYLVGCELIVGDNHYTIAKYNPKKSLITTDVEFKTAPSSGHTFTVRDK